jgi:hypothetical protein
VGKVIVTGGFAALAAATAAAFRDLGWNVALDAAAVPARVPAGRSAGSLSWAGLSNGDYWMDRERGVAGVMLAPAIALRRPGRSGPVLGLQADPLWRLAAVPVVTRTTCWRRLDLPAAQELPTGL